MSFQPEIVKGDPLYEAIVRVVKESEPAHVLEIGSANGLGSTQAFIEGALALIAEGKPAPTIYCLEAAPDRYDELAKNMKEYQFIRCFNGCSVRIADYMTDEEIDRFYDAHGYAVNTIRDFGRATVKLWRKDELEMISDNNVPTDWIYVIERCHDIHDFDIVLIDGSAFTGTAEYKQVRGAKWIIMDDVNDIKCLHAHTEAIGDGYEIDAEDLSYRNGYTVLRRVK